VAAVIVASPNRPETMTSSLPLTPSPSSDTLDRCWQRIGIWGDRACPELRSVVHCRNCPIYTQAGRNLLGREISEDVLLDWNQAKALNALHAPLAPQSLALNQTLSMMVFRLENEWFALSTAVFKEVTSPTTICNIPHRTNSILKGIVNVRGELHLCVSLTALLEIHPIPENQPHPTAYPRFLVIEQDGYRWVFPVDEIDGVHSFQSDTITTSPPTITHATETYTKGILTRRDRTISIIDEELLFYRLNHKLLS
jgi:chemotaxis-related protein WspD